MKKRCHQNEDGSADLEQLAVIKTKTSLVYQGGRRPDLAALAEILDRLARIEALLNRDRFDPHRLLLAELLQHFGSDTFAAGEAWRAARIEAEPETDLAGALRLAAIGSARGLAEWLARHPDVAAQGRDGSGLLWRITD